MEELTRIVWLNQPVLTTKQLAAPKVLDFAVVYCLLMSNGTVKIHDDEFNGKNQIDKERL